MDVLIFGCTGFLLDLMLLDLLESAGVLLSRCYNAEMSLMMGPLQLLLFTASTCICMHSPAPGAAASVVDAAAAAGVVTVEPFRNGFGFESGWKVCVLVSFVTAFSLALLSVSNFAATSKALQANRF